MTPTRLFYRLYCRFLFINMNIIFRGAKIEIIFGAFDLFTTDMNQIRVHIRRSQIQFNYFDNIALIQLNPNVELSGVADEIRLADEDDDLYIGDTAILTSWDETTRLAATVARKISPQNCSR